MSSLRTRAASAGRALDSLGGRLALYMAIALLPVGLLMVSQIRDLSNESRRVSEASLTGVVATALRDEKRLILRAQGVVGGLALLPAEVRDDPVRCSNLMRSVVQSVDTYAAALFIRADGTTECNSAGQTVDLLTRPGMQARLNEIMSAETFVLSPNPAGSLSGLPILSVSHTVRDAEGAVIGAMAVSIPYEYLPRMTRLVPDRPGMPRLLVYDADGDLLTGIEDPAEMEQFLPRDRSLALLHPEEPITFTGYDRNGVLRTYATLPMVAGELYAMGTWVFDPNEDGVPDGWVGPAALAAAMWVGSLLVVLMAGEFLIARHLRTLRRSVIGFASGQRTVRPVDLRGAPIELEELADAANSMMQTILRDEAELEDALHQKETLLREVHHRVKNNLQLIASIMNIQMREATTDEARRLMAGLHGRVMSLATIHRGLYQTSGQSQIRADELIDDIARQLLRMASSEARPFGLDLRLEQVVLTPDQAVPMALFLTEAMTNALKYGAEAPGRAVLLTIALQMVEADRVRLTVANPSAGEIPEVERTGVGSRLLTAFAMQLAGSLGTEAGEGRFRVTLEFTLRGHEATDESAEDETAEAGA